MTFSEGQTYSQFILEKHRYLEEIHSDVYLFRHQRLKAPLFAIKNDDSNKTFATAFNTIPTDSTGVAHILEHAVLMGSEKYPIKDVFGEINKGGLTTFLNAMTGSDVTYYPFATRNLKEYFNIMDVYCDVVFHPLLLRSTFEQEGWHYHQEAEEAPLQFQGVVFNEMKGAFSDPIRLIFQHIFGGLMPGSTYAHESGGDPQNIPDLSYEQFTSFHRHHYHPTNATFFVYGDADLADELSFINDKISSRFDQPAERRVIDPGTLTTAPIFVEDTYGVETKDLSGKTFLAVGTSVTTVKDRLQNAAFQIIANILFNSDGSPLKNQIISSGLCKDFGGLYLSSSCFRTFMITYLIGSEKENRDDFLALYNRALKEMVSQGLDHDLVVSELNKFEFSTREDASKAQRGLDLIGRAMAAFKYQADPFEPMVNEELIKTLRHKALNEGYFESLINEYLLANQATVVVTLTPDPEKGMKTFMEEQQRLQAYHATLSEDEKKQLIARTHELMQLQLKPNDEKTLSRLPSLQLDDLPSAVDFHSVTPTRMFDQTVLVSDLMTNRISFLDVGFDFSVLPQHLLPWLDIFGTIITEIGTEKMNYMQFAKEVATCTGNFSHSVSTYVEKDKPDSIRPVFWLHTKCLPAYLERTIELITSVIQSPLLTDRNRIREIVAREFAWAEHSAQSEGYNLPMTRVFAHLSRAGFYNEQINGVTGYLALKDLALNYPAREEAFLQSLSEIAGLLFNRNNLLLSITAEQQELDTFSRQGSSLVQALPQDNLMVPAPGPLALSSHEAFITSAEIVFAVLGGNLLPGGEGYNGHFEVLKTYLSRDYLWNTVRQLGGAYGCFVQFSHVTGNLALVSYRDPQVRKTYEAYQRIPQVVEELKLSGKELEQLIIGTYGNFDPLQSPAIKAATARNEYFSGITPEYKQERLRQISTSTVDDLRAFAPSFANMFENSYRSIIGNRAKIEADRDLFDTLTEL